MQRLPDAQQQVDLHLRLALVEGMRRRDLEVVRGAFDPLARALASLQEVEQVVDEIAIADA